MSQMGTLLSGPYGRRWETAAPQEHSSPSLQMQLVLQLQIVQHRGMRLVGRENVVAEAAVIRKRLAVLRRVAAVMAAEAAGIGHMADVVGIGPPGDLHIG